jgi:hypothetical protein
MRKITVKGETSRPWSTKSLAGECKGVNDVLYHQRKEKRLWERGFLLVWLLIGPAIETFAVETKQGPEMVTFEVLSPYANVDPPPAKLINERVPNLSGKIIGLFVNMKSAAQPLMEEIQKQIAVKFPTANFSTFNHRENNSIAGGPQEDAYNQWIKGVDVVITDVGD